ncbi:hypothetical protein CC78DRAFT_591201 [Lojkania enalia]|uniref:Major facilitator superfamily (MFS) profile domain-containing protein n=1 Tax=Lojkania enalia TaxID=147567 RepID=A0A9P4KGW2_9PLEO|nr:hypothetical protein CC78DRAFT_591201 [Didymosphaeria enalia]
MTRFLGLRGTRLASLINAICGLCFLCFGYAQGVLGGLLTVPAFLDRFPQVNTINNDSLNNARLQGITVGTWNLGCFASAIIAVFIGDTIGRRKQLILGLSIWIIGEIIQSSSYSFGQFIAGRFIAGFGNGFNTATVPAYQAECVKSHRKGSILMISAGAFVALGYALSYWLTFAFAYANNSSAAWRVPIAFQIVFALIPLSLILSLPESPRWLILTGREQEALTVLAVLNNEPEDSAEIRNEFLQIKDAILMMSQGSTSSMASNKERRSLHRAVLGYFVQVFQQMSGIGLFLQYFALIFYMQTSYTGWLARLLAGCATTAYFLASFIAVIGIDRFWGRRSLMMFGAAGMCLCMVLLTILVYFWRIHGVNGTEIAATVFLFGFPMFFAIGWQGMAWLYQVEIVPLRIRGPSNALSTSANWLFNFVVVLIAPIAFRNIGYRTYIIFACINFTIVPIIYFFYPETAYRSLEEVDVLFYLANESDGNPWLNVVKIAQREPLWFGRKGDIPFDYENSFWHQHFTSSGPTLGKKTNETPDSRQTANYSVSSPSNSRPSSDGNRKPLRKDLGEHLDDQNLAYGMPNPPFLRERQESTHSARSKSNYSAHSDSNWRQSDMTPPPLRLSVRYSDSAAMSHDAQDLFGSGPGIVRTESGHETYLPDGLPYVGFEEQRRSRQRNSPNGDGVSRRFSPREAGRGG